MADRRTRATLDQFRDLVRAQPFQPFEIVLVNGRRLEVRHPEAILVPEEPRFTLVAVLNARGAIELVNTLIVESIRPLIGNGRGRRRNTG